MMVLTASTGISTMRKRPAPTDAATVFRGAGRSESSRSARTPVLAAVSPKRLSGPCECVLVRTITQTWGGEHKSEGNGFGQADYANPGQMCYVGPQCCALVLWT